MDKNHRISVFICKARDELLHLRFSTHTRYCHELIWRKLEHYAAAHNVTHYTPSVGKDFKIHLCGRDLVDGDYYLPNREKILRHSIRQLDCLYYNGKMHRNIHKEIKRFPRRHSNLAEKYIEQRSTQIKPSSCRVAKSHLIHFLNYMERHSIFRPGKLTPAHISEYCKSLARLDNCTIHTYLCDLRAFLLFLKEFGYHKRDLSLVIPKFRLYQDAHIPTTWTPEEIKRLLEVVDRANPLGKRDYAMLTMVAILGIRIGDLLMLKLEDLDWREKRVNYVQEKDSSRQSLPITEAVGSALADYLKNGRPGTNCRNVFVRHLPPIGPFSSYNSYWTVFCSYLCKAGLSRKNRIGMHSLRHSLASHMLQNKIPLPVISNILGHAHSRTTNGYLKIDFDQLRQCCLSFGATEGQV